MFLQGFQVSGDDCCIQILDFGVFQVQAALNLFATQGERLQHRAKSTGYNCYFHELQHYCPIAH